MKRKGLIVGISASAIAGGVYFSQTFKAKCMRFCPGTNEVREIKGNDACFCKLERGWARVMQLESKSSR